MGLGANQTGNMFKLDIDDVNFHLLIKAELIMNVLLRLHTPNLGLTLGAFLINRKERGENVTMDKIVCYFTAHDKDNKMLLFITKYHSCIAHSKPSSKLTTVFPHIVSAETILF